jgi:hypothetical protein
LDEHGTTLLSVDSIKKYNQTRWDYYKTAFDYAAAMTEARPFLWLTRCGLTLRNHILWQRASHYEIPLPVDVSDIRKLVFTWYVYLKDHQSTSIKPDNPFIRRVFQCTDMDQYSLEKMTVPDELDVNHILFVRMQGVQYGLVVTERRSTTEFVLGRLRIPEKGENDKKAFKIYGQWFVYDRFYNVKQISDSSFECDGRIIYYRWLGIV